MRKQRARSRIACSGASSACRAAEHGVASPPSAPGAPRLNCSSENLDRVVVRPLPVVGLSQFWTSVQGLSSPAAQLKQRQSIIGDNLRQPAG